MKLSVSVFILFLLVAIPWGQPRAQEKGINWPPKDAVTCFAVNDGVVYAGTSSGGVIRTANNGRTWIAINSGLKSKPVTALVFSGGHLFAGTSSGVFVLTNGDQEWSLVGLAGESVTSLVSLDNNIFATTFSQGNILISSDNGATWTQVDFDMAMVPSVNSLVVVGDELFAGSVFGVLKSTRRPVGSSWWMVNAGLVGKYVSFLTFTGTKLFAGTNGYFYSSTDGGATWTLADSGMTNKFVTPLFKRLEVFGRTGSDTALTTPDITALCASGKDIYCGTDGGIFRSSDNGASWMVAGLRGVYVTSLAANDTNVFAGGYDGLIFLSANYGKKWIRVHEGLGAK